MTYIIQARLVRICYNDRDFSEQLKELFLTSMRNEPTPSRASVPCWHEHYRGEKEEGNSQHRQPITLIRL